MKEIIAKRNKKAHLFILVICIFTILISVLLMNVPTLTIAKYTAYAMIALCGTFSIALIILLVNPHEAIEKEENTLIIAKGIRRISLNISDISEVFPTPHPNNPDQYLNNALTIKATVDGKDTIIVCPDIVDVEEAIQKLTAMINS